MEHYHQCMLKVEMQYIFPKVTVSKISMSVDKQNIFILKTSFYAFSGRSLSSDIQMSALYNIQQNIYF